MFNVLLSRYYKNQYNGKNNGNTELFSVNFNSNKNKFLGLAYGRKNDIAISNISDANGVSIFSFKKHTFSNRVFILMLVYRKQFMQMQ